MISSLEEIYRSKWRCVQLPREDQPALRRYRECSRILGWHLARNKRILWWSFGATRWDSQANRRRPYPVVGRSGDEDEDSSCFVYWRRHYHQTMQVDRPKTPLVLFFHTANTGSTSFNCVPSQCSRDTSVHSRGEANNPTMNKGICVPEPPYFPVLLFHLLLQDLPCLQQKAAHTCQNHTADICFTVTPVFCMRPTAHRRSLEKWPSKKVPEEKM